LLDKSGSIFQFH